MSPPVVDLKQTQKEQHAKPIARRMGSAIGAARTNIVLSSVIPHHGKRKKLSLRRKSP
jgi:hypothetical protein